MKKLPDVWIIGAQRAGTTLLASLLCQHPRITWVHRKPEPMAWAWVEDPGGLVLAKSTKMLTDPRAPDLLDHPRLIVITRDPTDRAWSHYRYSVGEGVEDRPFEEAIALEGIRASEQPDEFHKQAYLTHSLYAEHVERWLGAGHPSGAILPLDFEDLTADPSGTAQEAAAWLDLEPFEPKPQGVVNAADPMNHLVTPAQLEATEMLDEYFRPHQRRWEDLLSRQWSFKFN